MERTIIGLRGLPKVGKTETICLAYEELRKKGRWITWGRRTRREVNGAIFEIDGVKVGFVSRGDAAKELEEDLKPLIEERCGVIVCAARMGDRGHSKTVAVVERLAKEAEPPYGIVWIEKDPDPARDHDTGNRRKAEEVIIAVHKAIARAQPAKAQLVEA
jgi:hypothetical protein